MISTSEKNLRETLLEEMEVDTRIITKIIEEFVPEIPFGIVETGGLKVGVVNDIPYIGTNPKITQKLLNKISRETGYIPHDIRETRETGPNSDNEKSEKVIVLVKDTGQKLGKSISLGKDTIYISIVVFDDR